MLGPVGNLIGINLDLAIFNPRIELLEAFRIVVFRNTCIDLKNPIVGSTDQVVATPVSVCQEGTTMGLTSIENGEFALCLTEARDDKIDILNQGMNGLIDFQFREFGERLASHWSGNMEC